jgi:purine-nucleoside phosphorylase
VPDVTDSTCKAAHYGAQKHLEGLLDGSWPEHILVLGSGLGGVIADLDLTCSVDYKDLPGFPRLGVAGHAGKLSVGRLNGLPLVVLQGREHFYEHGHADAMATPIRALRGVGCQTLLMTNAAGSVHSTMPPGSLMVVTDHINLTGANPLIGEPSGDARFVDMVDAYSPRLRALLLASAQDVELDVHEGVYTGFSGPSFETPAEIRATRMMGGDAVGMSLVPETILARHCGLEVGAVSVMTNFAAGIAADPLSHHQTMHAAAEAAPRCRQLIGALCSRLSHARLDLSRVDPGRVDC